MAINNFKEEYNFCILLQNSVMTLTFQNYAKTKWVMSENKIEFTLVYDKQLDVDNKFIFLNYFKNSLRKII